MSRKKVGALGIIYILVLFLLAGSVMAVTVFKVHLLSNTDLSVYVETSNVVTKKLKAERGTIYDRNSFVLAQDTQTYNIICYLSESRVEANGKPAYVTDIAKTSKILSKYLEMDEMTIYQYLTPNDNRTQTELGSKGRNLTKEVKEAIVAEELPGIEFVSSITRVYPQNDFASYLVGFAQADENGVLTGKMGVEKFMNGELQGEDGYKTYQADKKGYVLPGMKYEEVPEVNGNNVYLTIDKYLQEALQDSFKMTEETFNTYRVWGTIMEVDTGKILALGQSPSFNPNIKDISEYSNYISQTPYEAGSTMKVFTYATAIESGKYNGSQLVDSTRFCYAAKNKTPYRVACGSGKGIGSIGNASGKSWGMIPYDDGLKYSSNVVTSSLITEVITPNELKNKLYDFGFFNIVGTDGIDEINGVLNFEWPSEKLALSYGQGSTVTTLQMMQAFTAILGDGTMKKPYFIDKIVDPYTGETVSQTEVEITGTPISEETAKAVQSLMYQVANAEDGTARHYKIDEVEIIAKTGTSQLAVNGSYNSGRTISSVAIGLPAEDPKYFVYYAFEADYDYNAHYKTDHVKSLLKRLVQIESRNNIEEIKGSVMNADYEEFLMPNLVNHTIEYAESKLEDQEYIVIGDGDNVINQFPSEGVSVFDGMKIMLLTDTERIIAPNMYGWSRQNMLAFAQLTNRGVKVNGYGFAVSQSILPGDEIPEDELIEVMAEISIVDEETMLEKSSN